MKPALLQQLDDLADELIANALYIQVAPLLWALGVCLRWRAFLRRER